MMRRMLEMILYALGAIAVFVAFLAIVAMTVNWFIAAKPYAGPVSDHFDGKRFFNTTGATAIEPTSDRPSFWQWVLNRPPNRWEWRDNTTNAMPVERVMGDEIVVTFVNHATVLIQTQGLNILTDPIWSDRASPFSFAGPHRYRPPGLLFDDLPPIDVVMISHNHYDHMDVPTLRRLVERWHPTILVPLANASYLTDRGVTGVVDMDWWQNHAVSETVSVSAVAAQHFSSRGLTDRNRTLWGGYVIDTPRGQLYFAGDTGYGPFVEEIQKRFDNIIVGFIPIGAFKPEWFMGPVHVSPDEAIQMQRDLGVDTVIGIHFGTFHLADDEQDEPPRRVDEVLKAMADAAPDFRVPDNGTVYRF